MKWMRIEIHVHKQSFMVWETKYGVRGKLKSLLWIKIILLLGDISATASNASWVHNSYIREIDSLSHDQLKLHILMKSHSVSLYIKLNGVLPYETT